MNILHIFPTSGFDRSTTTPVLIGVLVSWLFTEWFGWVFAGLVVPGYLAAVFVLDPRAGMVDVAEAVFTYGLARFLGEHFARTGLTSRVFGRERFLLVVLSSIIVRLVFEGGVLPQLAPHAAGSFFSIGLVVVPLAANACWKTGLARGAIQNGVPTLVVYLLLRFVLVPYTNLSMAGFELATEDIAASFLASPKAYILLITGAVLAAASNVLDGWDFSGILVPALLALVVIEPLKFVATFVEALLLVGVVTVMLRATPLGRANIEGPRKLVLFFVVDYAMRFAFAGIAGHQLSGGDVVGVMGFGYLLPTLLAVKIAQKGNPALVLLPTAQVAVTAFVLGTLIGFSAMMLDADTPSARAAITRGQPRGPSEPISAALWASALARAAPRTGGAPIGPERYAAVADSLLGAPREGSGADTIDGADHLQPQRLDGGVLMLRESFDQLQDRWGDPVVLTTSAGRSAGRRMVVLSPTPLAAPEAGALGGSLLVAGTIDGVVIAGIEGGDRQLNPFESTARKVARALADRGADAGVVIAIVRGTADHPVATISSRAASAPRLETLLTMLDNRAGTVERKSGEPEGGVDVVIEIQPAAIARLFDDRPDPAPLGSPAALASVLDTLRQASSASSPEDELALRRLLLEPLLSPMGGSNVADERSLPMLRLAARALGYRLLGPGALPDGRLGVTLMADKEARPIAIVAHLGGTTSVLEVPQGYRGGVRDFALRFGAALDCDAILFGLSPSTNAGGDEPMRLAHAIATFPTQGRAPRVVLLREGAPEWDNAGVATLGSWGGSDRDAVAADVRNALGRLGVSTTDAPLDVAARDLAGRTLFGDVPLVAITIDDAIARGGSLDEARAATHTLEGAKLALSDGTPGAVAITLAKDLPKDGAPPPDDLPSIARSVAIEGSVVARGELARAMATTQTRAAIARGTAGDFLVVVSRTPKGIRVDVVSSDPRAKQKDAPPATPTRASLTECADVVSTGGACIAEAS